MIVAIVILIALFFAMNIGGSGAAATMGIAYGTGAIRSKIITLMICALGIFLGVIFGSHEVIQTIGTGLIEASMLTDTYVAIILTSACISLLFANVIGIPLSTSEVTVGAIIGVGFIYQAIYVQSLLYIMMWWIITPLAAYFIVYSILTCWRVLRKKWPFTFRMSQRVLIMIVIIAGFLEAVSAGMNNVANAVGPLVGAGILSLEAAMFVGGVFIALGAVAFGGKVLVTNGKKITKLSLQDGIVISFTSAMITIIASLFGIPIPMTQVTTSAIVGAGVAKEGKVMLQQSIIQKIIIVWVLSPLISFLIAYSMVQLLIESHFFMSMALSMSFLYFWYMKNGFVQKRLKQGVL